MPRSFEVDAAEFLERLIQVKQRVANAAASCGREAGEIKILAVSKGQSFSAIKTAYDCGVRDFGESYAQEMLEKIKFAKAKGLQGISWHFLGAIQSNKIKLIAQADVIHSVSSIRHATLIGQHCDGAKNIFCQVNLGLVRMGFQPDEIIDSLQVIKRLPHIHVLGLMTILPLVPKNPPEFWFDQMRRIKDQVVFSGILSKAQLSMGMSGDFLTAIRYGANIVRIGTALFGPRDEESNIFSV